MITLPSELLSQVGSFLSCEERACAKPTCRTFDGALTQDVLAYLATAPFFQEAFKRGIGRAESDEEKCRRIEDLTNRTLDLGRPLLSDEELRSIEIDPNRETKALTYQRRIALGNAIAEKRASNLINFFERIAGRLEIARDFSTLPASLSNREKAKTIRAWMENHRQDLLEFKTSNEVHFISVITGLSPRIPKEILWFLLPHDFDFLCGIACACILDANCEPLLEILHTPEFRPFRQNVSEVTQLLEKAYQQSFEPIFTILSRFEGYSDVSVEVMAELFLQTYH